MNQNNILPFTARAARTDRQVSRSEAAPVSDLTQHRADAGDSPRQLTQGEVWDAMNDGRVQMHYQPQFDLRSGEMVGAEALVRLIDRKGELVYPDRFIAMVENSALIVPLGQLVIDRVCAELASCRAAGLTVPRIAINLSAHQLNSDNLLLDFVQKTLNTYGLEYQDLEFELTERQQLEEDDQGLAVLEALASRGSHITLDDFGMGYSSVACLTELPIHTFKLDRMLVQRLPGNPRAQGIVRCLLAMAVELDLNVVAEGIENPAQQAWLAEAGCPEGQGFGLARPMNMATFQELVTDRMVAG